MKFNITLSPFGEKVIIACRYVKLFFSISIGIVTVLIGFWVIHYLEYWVLAPHFFPKIKPNIIAGFAVTLYLVGLSFWIKWKYGEKITNSLNTFDRFRNRTDRSICKKIHQTFDTISSKTGW